MNEIINSISKESSKNTNVEHYNRTFYTNYNIVMNVKPILDLTLLRRRIGTMLTRLLELLRTQNSKLLRKRKVIMLINMDI